MHRTNAARCAGGNNIPGQLGHYVGDKIYQLWHGIDKVAGITLLFQFSVQACFYNSITRVKLSLNTWSHGGKGVKTFGARPLHISLLQVAGSNVIKTGVA